MPININQIMSFHSTTAGAPRGIAPSVATSTTQETNAQLASKVMPTSTLSSLVSWGALNIHSKREAHLEYERTTRSHQDSIALYLHTQHAAKREEIQQMVGVDVYA